MRIQTELALLDRRSEELQRQLEEEEDEEPNVNRFVEEYQQLMSENVSCPCIFPRVQLVGPPPLCSWNCWTYNLEFWH